MPTAILRPNGTLANTGPWSITGAASAHEAVDDVVTQPTAASTSEIVATSTAGHILDLALTDSPSDCSLVTAFTVWTYDSTAGNDRIQFQMRRAGNTAIGSVGLNVNRTTSYTWSSYTVTGLTLSKEDIDGAFLRLTSALSGTMSEVRCAATYVEITYDAATLTGETSVDTLTVTGSSIVGNDGFVPDAISFVGVASTGGSGATVNAAVPAGLWDGDVLIASVGSEAAVTIETPDGWTPATPQAQVNLGSHTARVFARVVPDGFNEPDTHPFTQGQPADMRVTIAAYRKVDPDRPVMAGAIQANGTNTAITAPSVSTDTADAWVVWMGTVDTGLLSPAVPAGTTQRYVAGALQVARAALADYIKAAYGPTGSLAGSISEARANTGAQVALRPMPVPPAGTEIGITLTDGLPVSGGLQSAHHPLAQTGTTSIDSLASAGRTIVGHGTTSTGFGLSEFGLTPFGLAPAIGGDGITTTHDLTVSGREMTADATTWTFVEIPWPTSIVIQMQDAPAALVVVQGLPTAAGAAVPDPVADAVDPGEPGAEAFGVAHPGASAASIDDAPASLLYFYPADRLSADPVTDSYDVDGPTAVGIAIDLPGVIMAETEDVSAIAYAVAAPSATAHDAGNIPIALAFDIGDAPGSLVYMYPLEA